MHRQRLRRRQARRPAREASLLAIEDWILLTLLSCLGLVWSRLIFVFAAMTSACAEQYAVMGLVETGWLKGQTVWSLLFWTTCLASVYTMIVIITQRSKRWTTLMFRILMLSGFMLIGIGFRMMVVDNPVRPAGIVMTNHHAPIWDDAGRFNRNYVMFQTVEEIWGSGRPACLLERRQQLVLPNISQGWRYRRQNVLTDRTGLKGLLIEAHKDSQIYIDLSDSDYEFLEKFMIDEISVNNWPLPWPQIMEKIDE